MKSLNSKTLLASCIVLCFFILSIFLAHYFENEIRAYTTATGIYGKAFFVLMAIIAVVIPLWSNMFLLPIGSVAWGPITTALLCIFGWWIGSVTAFYLGRSYSSWLLKRYPSLSSYEYIDRWIPARHSSFHIIFLRMTIPVDVLSYDLGLFSQRISWKQNAITTLIGVTPFAFIFSYAGNEKMTNTTVLFVIGITTTAFIVYVLLRKIYGNARPLR